MLGTQDAWAAESLPEPGGLRWMRASIGSPIVPLSSHREQKLLSRVVITGYRTGGPCRPHVGFNDSPSLSSNYQRILEERSLPPSSLPAQSPGLPGQTVHPQL